MEEPKIAAHRVSIRHREQIISSEICGCFYCLSIFPPNHVTVWADSGETANAHTVVSIQSLAQNRDFP